MTMYSPSVGSMFLLIGIGCAILFIIPMIIYSIRKVKKVKERFKKWAKVQ